MKINTKLLSLLVLSFLVVFSACKDDDPSAEEEKLSQLNGTWNITQAVTADGTIDLTDVTITLTAANTTYAIAGLATLASNNLNNGQALESSGTFSLNSDNLNQITLNNNTVITITITGDDLAAVYSAPYPKEADSEQPITLTGSK